MRTRVIYAIFTLTLLAGGIPIAQAQESAHGAEMPKYVKVDESKSFRDKERKRLDYTFIPRGEWLAGVEVSHASLSSSKSELFLMIDNLNADCSVTNISPFAAYFLSDNHCLGLKYEYSFGKITVETGGLNIDGLDLSFDNLAVGGMSHTFGLFHRSYVGLGSKGRFGLFNHTELCYVSSRMLFYDSQEAKDRNEYIRGSQLKLTFNPGLVVFTMNHLSMHASIGVGGFKFSRYDNYSNGVRTGRRSTASGNFRINVTDISLGVVAHLWSGKLKK